MVNIIRREHQLSKIPTELCKIAGWPLAAADSRRSARGWTIQIYRPVKGSIAPVYRQDFLQDGYLWK
jgi:hypothetical protein